jgi:hypothetical protein
VRANDLQRRGTPAVPVDLEDHECLHYRGAGPTHGPGISKGAYKHTDLTPSAAMAQDDFLLCVKQDAPDAARLAVCILFAIRDQRR